MADSKVSALTPATTVHSADLLYLIQNSTDKKLSIANLFAAIPVLVQMNKKIAFGGTAQVITTPGSTVSLDVPITKLNPTDSSGSIIMPVSDIEGQMKLLVMTGNDGDNTLSITANIPYTSVSFANVGDTAFMMCLGSLWYFLGGTATVVE